MASILNTLSSFLNPINNLRFSLHDSTRHSNHQRYTLQSIHRNRQICSMSTPINGIGLDSLKNTAEDGFYLRQSIQRWLDIEYIPQIVHLKIGIEVEKLYLQRRLVGVTDLGEMLMDIGTALELFDMEVCII